MNTKPKANSPLLIAAAIWWIAAYIAFFLAGFIAMVLLYPAVLLACIVAMGLSVEFAHLCLDRFRQANGLPLLEREPK